MEDVGSERVMRYVTTAGRARAEASLVPGNTGFVERFVAQATGVSATSGRPTAAGRALFELLWPDRIKEMSREDRNVRLVLDQRTAAFPWELLDDRRPWLEAGRRSGRQAAQACGCPGRPDSPARANPIPREGRGTGRPPPSAGGGRSARRAAGRLPAVARRRGRVLLVAERLSGAGYQVTHLHRRQGVARAGRVRPVRAGLEHRPHRRARGLRL